jgi:hypothetical protein
MSIGLNSVYLSLGLAYTLDGLLVEVTHGTMIINTHDDDIKVRAQLLESFCMILTQEQLRSIDVPLCVCLLRLSLFTVALFCVVCCVLYTIGYTHWYSLLHAYIPIFEHHHYATESQ